MTTRAFDQIGADGLRAAIADFYDRVFADVMIGFMFAGKDKHRLIQLEWELVARMLGASEISYTGRPIRAAHAAVRIFGGQFERRLQILRETLRDRAVPAEVQQVWIDHTLALRSQVTRDQGSECKDPGVALAVAPPVQSPDARLKLGKK